MIEEENNNKLLEEKLNELDAIKNRINDYDWDYRLKRFEEKVQFESLEVVDRLKNIK